MKQRKASGLVLQKSDMNLKSFQIYTLYHFSILRCEVTRETLTYTIKKDAMISGFPSDTVLPAKLPKGS